jgi:hypothetical protein
MRATPPPPAAAGCILCRDEASKLWAQHEQLEAAGMRVVCVVKEWVEAEMAAFLPKYWGGSDVYLDADMAFYKVRAGGGPGVCQGGKGAGGGAPGAAAGRQAGAQGAACVRCTTPGMPPIMRRIGAGAG